MTPLQLPLLPLLLLLLPLLSLAHALALSHAAAAAADHPAYDYGFDVHKRVKRHLSRRSALVVQGAKTTATTEIGVRQEIRQLELDKDCWTLYILGLSMMQFTDQGVATSYYGLAGIHGMPHQTWGDVRPVPGSENTGYCTHSSVLFPTWHRPYMALYEQVLHGLIQLIASFWPEAERARYEEAAKRFRLPYWDWALNPPTGGSVLPKSIGGSSFVDVQGPNGLQRIANPLFTYSFRPLNATAFISGPWNTWARTLRSPSSGSPDAQSNNSLVGINLDKNQASMAQRLYNLFAGYDNYTSFSNNALGAQADSLESIHDTIHTLVGGFGAGSPAGHMAYIQWSAFDPVFFLHHCMVDRIFAIWQTLHPNAWVAPTRSLTNSYTIRRGQTLSASTALTPFFSTENGTFWDSNGVRDHTKFGYTYPELVLVETTKKNVFNKVKIAQLRTVRQAVNRLYGSFSPASLFLEQVRAAGIKVTAGNIKSPAVLNRLSLAVQGTTAAKIFVGDSYRDWTATVRVAAPAVAKVSSVHFFLAGAVPADPRDWPSARNLVGTMGVFGAARYGQGQEETGGGGGGGHEVPVSGTVPLTAALVGMVNQGGLASLEEEDVEGFVKGNLKVRMLGTDGEVLAQEGCLEGVEVGVVSAVVAAPWSEDELPKWGEAREVFTLC